MCGEPAHGPHTEVASTQLRDRAESQKQGARLPPHGAPSPPNPTHQKP